MLLAAKSRSNSCAQFPQTLCLHSGWLTTPPHRGHSEEVPRGFTLTTTDGLLRSTSLWRSPWIQQEVLRLRSRLLTFETHSSVVLLKSSKTMFRPFTASTRAGVTFVRTISKTRFRSRWATRRITRRWRWRLVGIDFWTDSRFCRICDWSRFTGRRSISARTPGVSVERSVARFRLRSTPTESRATGWLGSGTWNGRTSECGRIVTSPSRYRDHSSQRLCFLASSNGNRSHTPGRTVMNKSFPRIRQSS